LLNTQLKIQPKYPHFKTPICSANGKRYRYGFNGKEKDNETYGEGNAYDFGARIYDSRLGRWLSLDPLMAKYPFLSPYNFCINNPILFKDYDGRDIILGESMEKDKFYTGALAIAQYSKIVTTLMNKYASTNSGNITNSSSGVLSRHTLEFNKSKGRLSQGETKINVKIDGKFVKYVKGMELPNNAEFKIVIDIKNIYASKGDYEKGTLAGVIAHELLVHAELATEIIEQYENELKTAGNDKEKIAEAQNRLKENLDNWETVNNGIKDKLSEAHQKMENGDTQLDEALDEITTNLDSKISNESDPNNKKSLENTKQGVIDVKNEDVPKQ
jgi:RHS repeat-associated protein